MRVVNVVATCTGQAEELLRRYPHAETRAGAAVYGDGWTALVYRTGRVFQPFLRFYRRPAKRI